MLPLSAAASQVLRTSHQMNRRVTAFTVAQGALPIRGIAGGSISCDAKSAIRRTLSMQVADPRLFPAAATDPLSEVASDLGVEYGVVIPGVGTEWLQVFRGPIQDVEGKLVRVKPDLQVSGLQVTASSRAQRIVDNRLTAPIQTRAGAAVAEITRLIGIGDPTAEVVDVTGGSTATVGSVEVDKDLWGDGIQKLAAAAGLVVDTDPWGRYRIKNVPTLDDPAVWRIDAGEGGVLIEAGLKRSRSSVYNAVQASSGDQNNGAASVSALVVDDDPASPTYWGGPFGQKVRFYTNPALTTVDQCQRAARGLLAKLRGLSRQVSLTAVTNPALEEGDVIEVDLGDGRLERHIVDSFPIDLSPGSQQLTTRAVVELPAEQ